ncbi:MAG: hypothetical protein H0T10_05785, partial [Actinobacteria bacterium]|nr:hypothetical protein [Actinomycetota bacterium]
MIRHPEYTRARLAQTSERLRALVYARTRAPEELLVAGPVDRIGRDEAQELEYRPAELGERFGPLWATYWFRATGSVPPEWAGRRVDLLWDSASEATLWLDGLPAQGLNEHHHDAALATQATAGEQLFFEVELACNGLFGRLLSELNRFCNVWPGEEAPEILAALYERRNATTAHELAAIGHAHLDTAWLWPLAETYRKAVRTFTTQAQYLRAYPEYRFACPQAQQYA